MSRTPSIPNDKRQPVIGVTGPAAAVLTELHDRPDGATVAALALAAGISRSTAAKVLTVLEGRGLAWRTSGGNDRTRRLPDTWHLTTPETAVPGEAARSAEAHDRTERAETPAEAAPNPGSQTTASDQVTPQVQQADGELDRADLDGPAPASGEASGEMSDGRPGEPAGDPDAEAATVTVLDTPAKRPAERLDDGNSAGRSPEADQVPLPPTTGDPVPAGTNCPTCGHRRRQAPVRAAAGDGSRLGQGQLHQLALDHLRAHPELEWTATGIAKVITAPREPSPTHWRPWSPGARPK